MCSTISAASSFYRTNLVEVANVGRMTQILPVKSETGQEIRRRTSDILPVQEHQRFIGAHIEVSRLGDTLDISAIYSLGQVLQKEDSQKGVNYTYF